MQFFIIGLLTYLIALFGFTHIVAGTAEALNGALTGITSPWQAFAGFFLPKLADSIIGGAVLFSVLSYAQPTVQPFWG
jgi:formate/nitrite transporter FocA (FNT family)